MAFTDNLQSPMGAKGISRRKSAKGCGIGPGAVNPWFNRSAGNIGLPALGKLSDCFGISIEELVHGTETRREPVFTSDTCTEGELAQVKRFAHFLIGQREGNG